MNDSKLASHLVAKRSERGFAHLPAIQGAYGGMARAYESSAASGPHVWLAVEVPQDPNNQAGPTVEATIHLTADNAIKLADQLMHLVVEHYQRGSEWGGRR